jgi:hypothetical protein
MLEIAIGGTLFSVSYTMLQNLLLVEFVFMSLLIHLSYDVKVSKLLFVSRNTLQDPPYRSFHFCVQVINNSEL